MAHRLYKFLIHNQVIFALFLLFLAWFVYQTRGILVSVFLSYIIMAALSPIVLFLQQKRVPKYIAVIITYIGVIAFSVVILIPVISLLISQVSTLLNNFPTYINYAATTLGITLDPKQIQTYFTREFDSIGHNAFSVTSAVFGGVFSTLTVFIISLYLLLYRDKFRHGVASLFHKDARPHVLETLHQVDYKLGAWLRGQLILCIFIGVLTWLVLQAIGVPYALPLAVVAGFLEAIPTLGPILASIPAIIVAFTISPAMAATVVLAYILIQLFENNILVPKIMQKAVGLNPILVILAVTIGAKLMGVAGALLSIPFVSFLIVLFNSMQNQEKE